MSWNCWKTLCFRCGNYNVNTDSPNSLHIDITTGYPLNGVQCYKQPVEEFAMTFESFESIINQAVQLEVFQIAIGGGETLTHKDLFMIERMTAPVLAEKFEVNRRTIGRGIDALCQAGILIITTIIAALKGIGSISEQSNLERTLDKLHTGALSRTL